MDYEKLHKDTINKLHQMVNSGKITVKTACGICADFVPESEDEKIRKELISFVRGMLACHDKPNAERDEKYESWIAWLEKQGKNDMGISEVTKKKLADSLNKALEKETPESCNEFLDEQGEQKPAVEMKIPEESLGIDYDTYNKIVDECIYGEQKPIKEHNTCEFCEDKYGCVIPCPMKSVEEEKSADKVKSKFKVGDFIANDYCVGKVIALTDDAYLLDTGQGIPFSCEHNAHLWTIQDAKDGDVLEFGDHGRLVVGIVSYVNKTTGRVDVNCLLENNNFKVGNYYNLDTIKPHPAAKEQRDTLMKAMADAGYTFDFEKKELKKIEQKSAWSEEDEEVLLRLTSFIEDWDKIAKGNKSIRECTLWSSDEYLAVRLLNFLKSLKERVQPKQEWSEKDEINLKKAIWYVENPAPMVVKDSMLVEWLKSLRPQSTWKPSDEQMNALSVAVKHGQTDDPDALKKLLEQLKKLREE